MIIAINGSPRKKGNTATLLGHALEGAKSKGAPAELVHLHDLTYRGCVSCFACKHKGGNLGHCALHDDLSPLLERLREAEAILLGSPIYFWDVTGALRSFMERFLFSNMLYNRENRWLFPKRIPSALIYTWGASEEAVRTQDSFVRVTEKYLGMMFGTPPSVLYSVMSLQFNNYSRYETDALDEEAIRRQRREVFPQDCQKAFEIGASLVR